MKKPKYPSVKIGDEGTEVPIYCAHTDVVEIEKLVPNPKNPNTHPYYQIEMLAKIIVAQGWRSPITVSRRSGFIVRGHGRFTAAIKAGFSKVPVDYQDYQDEAAEWADLVADNRIAELSEIDMNILRKGFEELDLSTFDAELAGFSAVELDRIISEGKYEIANDAEAEWKDMPEFNQGDTRPFRTIAVHFKDDEAVREFYKRMKREYSATLKYLWFPEPNVDIVGDLRWKSADE
jgi:hypothetical protein